MYRVKGSTQKNIPKAHEYAHQEGSILAWSLKKDVNT